MRIVLGAAAVAAASVAYPVAADIGGPPMRSMTESEAAAHAVWSLRSALNVAALQCQFSPFLATVRTYNDLLKQHDKEFSGAYKAMEKHFLRHDGSIGRRNFDSFTTRLYNSFSALDAQIGFCEASGTVGRAALAVRPGDIQRFAGDAVRRVRAAMVPVTDPYRQVTYVSIVVPRIPDPCLDKKGRPVKRCKV